MHEVSRNRELIGRNELAGSADLWEPQYGIYDRARFLAKFEQLDRLLAGSVPDRDREQNAANITDMYDVFEGRREVAPALFAYFASSRIERARPDYGSDIVPFLPLLKYVEAEFGFTADHVADVARQVAKGATVNSSTT